jgi:hypothetical protein
VALEPARGIGQVGVATGDLALDVEREGGEAGHVLQAGAGEPARERPRLAGGGGESRGDEVRQVRDHRHRVVVLGGGAADDGGAERLVERRHRLHGGGVPVRADRDRPAPPALGGRAGVAAVAAEHRVRADEADAVPDRAPRGGDHPLLRAAHVGEDRAVREEPRHRRHERLDGRDRRAEHREGAAPELGAGRREHHVGDAVAERAGADLLARLDGDDADRGIERLHAASEGGAHEAEAGDAEGAGERAHGFTWRSGRSPCAPRR